MLLRVVVCIIVQAVTARTLLNERLLDDLMNEESKFFHRMKLMAVKVEELVKENSEVHAAPIVRARWLFSVTCASGLQP